MGVYTNEAGRMLASFTEVEMIDPSVQETLDRANATLIVPLGLESKAKTNCNSGRKLPVVNIEIDGNEVTIWMVRQHVVCRAVFVVEAVLRGITNPPKFSV